jgi:hypothetical protein
VDKGYKVISVQNPATSLEDDVAATKRAIDRADGDVVLVPSILTLKNGWQKELMQKQRS